MPSFTKPSQKRRPDLKEATAIHKWADVNLQANSGDETGAMELAKIAQSFQRIGLGISK